MVHTKLVSAFFHHFEARGVSVRRMPPLTYMVFWRGLQTRGSREKKAMKRKGPARDLKREIYWRGVFSEHRRSGLNIRDFCRRKGLREPLFYAWRREVKRRGRLRIRKASRPGSTQSVRPRLSKAVKPRTKDAAFVPIQLSGGMALSSGLEAVECVLPSGTVLRCPPHMEPAAIAALVHAWEEGRC